MAENMATEQDIETPLPKSLADDDFQDNVIVDTSNNQEKSNHTSPSASDSSINNGGIRHQNRDSFFSFIPQLAKFGAGIVGGELNNARKGITAAPSFTKNFLVDTFQFYKANPRTLFDEVISGFTVAIMQVPESIAFSFVAGVPPLSGLQATFWMATITGVLGGKPGMISGAAGALAVVVDELTIDDGVLHFLSRAERLNVLYMTMFICGIMQIAFAWFRLAKVVRLIPETGMIGFMNGLAIIIFMAQLPAFQKCPVDGIDMFVDCKISEREWLTFQHDGGVLGLTLMQVVITMIIMQFFRKIPKIGTLIPASLVALLFGTLIEHTLIRKAIGLQTRTVGQTAPMSGDLPKFDWPEVPQSDVGGVWRIIITYALTLAAIGGVESVLTLQACNEITDTVPKVSDCNQELFAQGLANLVCGLFRAMGGDAMIGQSTINIMNGARHRVSSTCSGLFMLLFIVAISPFIELIPVATLTGVLFMIVLNTFQWQTFNILRYGRLSDSAVILIVTLVAVFYNLAVGIVCGIVFSALVYAWDSGALVSSDIVYKKMLINGEEKDVKYVHIRGAIFFGSARNFISYFSVSDDPETVVLDLKDAIVVDHSAVAAIGGVTHRFKQADKQVLLTNVPHKCNGRLHRTGDHNVLAGQIKRQSHFGEIAAGGQKSISDLNMLHGNVEDVSEELQQLEDEQGDVTIGEVNKKEN